MKFSCTINDLSTICRLVASRGKNIEGKEYTAVYDCVINAVDTTLKVQAMDIQKTFVVQVDYVLPTISEEGPLPIGDIPKFEEFLSRFNPDDNVSVSTEGNRIIIFRENPKKSAKIPLASIDAIMSKDTPILQKLQWKDGVPDTGKISFNISAIVDASDITNVIADGSVVKQRILPWKIVDNKLQISIGSEVEGTFETDVVLEGLSAMANTNTAFGNGIDNIFNNLTGKVKIYLSSVPNSPLVVEQKTEKFNFLGILAPNVMSE